MVKKALAAGHIAGTAVIKFDKDHHGGRVRGAVNGQKFDLPVDSDVTVTEDQLNALNDSGAKFTVVTPLGGDEGAGEGSSAPSTTIEGSATRLEPVVEGEGEGQAPAPVLQQVTDKELIENAQTGNIEEAKAEQAKAEKAATAAKRTAKAKA